MHLCFAPSIVRTSTMNTLTRFLVGAAAAAGRTAAQFCEHQWEGEFADPAAAAGVPHPQVRQEDVAPPPLEIRPLIVNGPSDNRVDLIFFGDGCTCDEMQSVLLSAGGVNARRC